MRYILFTAIIISAFISPARATDVDTQTNASNFRGRFTAILDELARTGDFEIAKTNIDAFYDEFADSAPVNDKELIRDASFAVRLIHQLADLKMSERYELFLALREQADLGRALTFSLDNRRDKFQSAYELFERLRAERSEAVLRFPNLAVAISIVHDRPLIRRINENKASAPDPLFIFDYYVANENRMMFGIRDVPVELLMYVVDTTASIDEMVWALNKYAGHRNVGALFFDIKYDYEHFRDGDTKEVTARGFSLPNILRYGGVCADQAYFAVQVGKAIGVPTTYTRGRASQTGHAWVGFLQSDKDRAWWNFNSGRYAAYQGVRGNVVDPQTNRTIPDSSVSLLADLVRASELDRQYAAAMTDVITHLRSRLIVRNEDDPKSKPTLLVPQRDDVEKYLSMLESALRACPGYAPLWYILRDMADNGELTLDDKKKWATVLHRLCGTNYPDFEMEILEPMIESVVDVNEQNALWNAAFENMSNRADLAAEIRMAQAKMWRKAGQPQKAGQCCEDIIYRYANVGPFVVDALREAESILNEAGEQRRIVALYDRAWSQIKKPQSMAPEFMRQTNWYRVGKTYATRLEAAGYGQKAADIKRAIGAE